MPKTKLGKWSVGLIIVFILLLILFFLLVASGQRGGDTFFSNPLLTIPMLVAGICGVGAFFTGIISIIKMKERAIIVYIATVIGFFVLMYISAEILSPH